MWKVCVFLGFYMKGACSSWGLCVTGACSRWILCLKGVYFFCVSARMQSVACDILALVHAGID